MADDSKIGIPWQDDELDAIVSDYFSMLEAELSGRHYVKAHHSAALMQQVGRIPPHITAITGINDDKVAGLRRDKITARNRFSMAARER